MTRLGTAHASEVRGQWSRRELIVAFSAIMLVMLLAALDQTIVATALPRIVGDLQGFDHLSWVVTAYILAATVTIPLYGKLSDDFGRRAMLVIAIVIFLSGSALCGVAGSMEQLIAFRALQGIGGGGLLPLALAAVGDLFSPRERGRYQGFLGAVWAVASIAGPLVGGTLTDVASWRWIFFVNLPLGVLALLVVLRTMPRRGERKRQRIDYLGAGLLTAGVTSLLLASVWGGTSYPWDSPTIVVTAGGGALLVALFVIHEWRTSEPLVSLRLFRVHTIAMASTASLLTGAVLFALTIYVPLYVQGVLGESATRSGAVLLPLQLAWVLASAASGQVVSRTGRYRIFPIVGGVLLVLGFWKLTRLDSDTSTTAIAVCMAIVGTGLGLTSQVYVTAAQNAVRHSQIGIATALLQFFRSIGGSFAVAGFAAFMSNRLAAELAARLGSQARRVDPNQLLQPGGEVPPDLLEATREPLAIALHSAFTAGVPVAIACLAIALALKEVPLRQA